MNKFIALALAACCTLSGPTAAQMKADDIIGMKLGMPVAEADKIIRAHMKVELVAASGVEHTGSFSSFAKPWRETISYHTANNTESITLVVGEPKGNTVRAVYRHFTLPADFVKRDKVIMKGNGYWDSEPRRNLLYEKYGKNDQETTNGPYLSLHWNAGKSDHCLFVHVPDSSGSDKPIEGAWDSSWTARPSRTSPVPRFPVNTKDDVPRVSDLHKKCGTTLTATLVPVSFRERMYLALYNFALLVPIYEKSKASLAK